MRRQPVYRLDVVLLRSSSQLSKGHVLDHPLTQWRHLGSPFVDGPPHCLTHGSFNEIHPSDPRLDFTTPLLGEAVPSNLALSDRAKARLAHAASLRHLVRQEMAMPVAVAPP
jgi:hypothetical protein